jgi:predicted ATP-dependent endonuclease of OLD family
LHGTAQAKLVEFLEKMSADNQLFYTTHSPFMIDGAHLERAVALSEDNGDMRVSTDVWPRDRDSLFPLQAALGYSVCQSLFVSKKQVMVEGMTDYALLSALNQHLVAGGKEGLNRAITMVPMGGTTNLAPLASMLIGHDIEIAVLLDSDPAGAKGMAKMRKLLADFDQRCFQISSYGGEDDITELEDLLPEKYYLDAVKRAYPNVEIKFNASEKKIASIVDRVQRLFERLEAEPFEKWRPIHEVVQVIYSDPKGVPAELLDAANGIFKDINAALATES